MLTRVLAVAQFPKQPGTYAGDSWVTSLLLELCTGLSWFTSEHVPSAFLSI